MKTLISRRSLLKSMGVLAIGAPLMSACAPKVEESAAPAASQPSTPKEAEPAPKAKEEVSIAVWTIAGRPWQKEAAEEYQEMHPEVVVKIEEVPYPDMAKKQLTQLATGTMQDLTYSGIKWYAYGAYKGAFLALDDIIDKYDFDMSDFTEYTMKGIRIDDKLYSLPFEMNPGNLIAVYYNKDILAEYGVDEPPSDYEWGWEDYIERAVKLTDKDAGLFGGHFLPTNYYDAACFARSWGGDVINEDATEWTMHTDPKCMEACKMIAELRTKHGVMAMREDAEGLAFDAGRIAMINSAVQTYGRIRDQVGDKFEWDLALYPKGPDGLRGYEAFVSVYSMASVTEVPDLAFDLLQHIISPEVQQRAFVTQSQPASRVSVWSSDETAQINKIYPAVAEWMTDGVNTGAFPMPNNFRFSELQDKYANLIPEVWYGEVPFEEGMANIGEQCNEIVKLPRG